MSTLVKARCFLCTERQSGMSPFSNPPLTFLVCPLPIHGSALSAQLSCQEYIFATFRCGIELFSWNAVPFPKFPGCSDIPNHAPLFRKIIDNFYNSHNRDVVVSDQQFCCETIFGKAKFFSYFQKLIKSLWKECAFSSEKFRKRPFVFCINSI